MDNTNVGNSAAATAERKLVWTGWTLELNSRFMDAIINLRGIQNSDAAASQILELMNVPELTEENVASHLQEEEDDDSWLASIDFDAMVSQFIQNPTTSSQVTAAKEIPITSQPPPLGEDEDSQEPVSTKERKKEGKTVVGRTYRTRSKSKPRFQNTSDDPIDIN
nr:G2-like myb-family transcription factor [Ipomoea batatas]